MEQHSAPTGAGTPGGAVRQAAPGSAAAPGPTGRAATGAVVRWSAARPASANPVPRLPSHLPKRPRPAPGGSDGGGPDGGRGKLPGVLRVLLALRRPRARLTGLGTGALTTVVTVLAGLLDSALFDGPGTFFGVAFIAVCVAAAFYVRPYDLVAAPVAAPIAFALAITLTAGGGGGGLAGRLMGVFTGLALMTGWLYTGTVLAAVIVVVRALRLPSPRPRSPRCSAAPRGRSAR